jgi:hypothetical protein
MPFKYNMDSLSEPCTPPNRAVQPPAASPASRDAKRAAIQKVVEERRKQMAAERQMQVTVEARSLLQSSRNQNDGDANPDILDSFTEVFPEPSLSPSQQKALDHHQTRMLQGRVIHSAQHSKFQWGASLRDLSSPPTMENAGNVEHRDRIEQRTKWQESGESIEEQSRKSPLSRHFEDVVGSVRDKWLLSPQNTPPSAMSRTKNSERAALVGKQCDQSEGNISRQLDFDSENFSFESSPLKIYSPGPFAAVRDLLVLAQSLDRMPFSSRAMIAHHVGFTIRNATQL